MPIGSTNISFSDLRTEYVGGNNNSVSFSQLYRSGSNILEPTVGGLTNAAASVPTSGVISLDDFKNTARAFRKTYSSNATNQDASTVFGSDYAVDYPKQIIINNGVELGATSTSNEALQIDTGLAGSISITNNGTITGAGGAAGAAGGDAFEADVACTLVNNGTIRSGGGGGGTGGSGSQTTTASATTYYLLQNASGSCTDNGFPSGSGQSTTNVNSTCPNPYSGYDGYSQGVFQYINYQNSGGDSNNCQIKCYRKGQTTSNTSGGAGGVGAGYGQSAGGGSSGGTAAGSGGAGGAFGTTGSTGANGSVSNGSAGGSAGNAITGISNVTLTNTGTITGPQA
tara:strand:+ start:2506 stop:3528 length:1023 start_codon:yes stop_codon:yes gene_type:complete